MDEAIRSLLPWKGAVVLAWLALVFAAERLRPAAREPRATAGSEVRGGPWRLARNGGLWLANVGLTPLIVVPVSFWAAEHSLAWRPDGLRGPVGLVLDLIVLDFLIYWWHRANHVVPFLWRFHEVHHLDRFLDSTTALRFHYGELLLSAAARAVVIILLDIPFTSIIVFETVIFFGTIFHHSNLALPPALERGLSRVIITPAIHWVHHHATQRDTDSNYGTIFSFWDPLFGSRSATARTPDMTIGVQDRAERGFTHLFLRPFLSARRRLGPATGAAAE